MWGDATSGCTRGYYLYAAKRRLLRGSAAFGAIAAVLLAAAFGAIAVVLLALAFGAIAAVLLDPAFGAIAIASVLGVQSINYL